MKPTELPRQLWFNVVKVVSSATAIEVTLSTAPVFTPSMPDAERELRQERIRLADPYDGHEFEPGAPTYRFLTFAMAPESAAPPLGAEYMLALYPMRCFDQ